MPKYYVGCEGSQQEFYEFLIDLAQKVNWAECPFEHPAVEKAAKEGKLSTNYVPPKPVVPTTPAPTSAPAPKPGPTPVVDMSPIQSDPLPFDQPAEAPAPAEDGPTYITKDQLQKKCMALGDAYGKQAFKELKAKAGFTSMSALDGKGRQAFANMIDAYIAEHTNA